MEYFARTTSLEILLKIRKDVQDQNIEPENFEERIIFVSMSKNIDWKKRGNSEMYFEFRTSQELREEISREDTGQAQDVNDSQKLVTQY